MAPLARAFGVAFSPHIDLAGDGSQHQRCVVLVAEAYELQGHPRLALRWYNIPFTHSDPFDDAVDQLLLAARRRVRAQLGLAPDRLDRFLDEA